jgi:hypothetical protein
MDTVQRDYMGPNRKKFNETAGYKALAKDLEEMKDQNPTSYVFIKKRMERGFYSDLERCCNGPMDLWRDLEAAGFKTMVERFKNDCYDDICAK